MADKTFLSYTTVAEPPASDYVLIADDTNGVRKATIQNLVDAAQSNIIEGSGSTQLSVAANGYAASADYITLTLPTGFKMAGITVFTGNEDVICGVRAITDTGFKVYVKNFSGSTQEPYIYYFWTAIKA